MWRKSVLSAVCAGNGTFEVVARRIAAGQQHRSFTSTCQRNANITTFTPTSSPDLDSLLQEIRHKIILPAYLPMDQRKKIYSVRWQKKLEADPITIEIDGEVLKFRYLNPLKDIPGTRKSIEAALRQFNTPGDFANLKPLLEGIHYAGRKIDQNFYAKILRIIGGKGHIYDMIDCARSVRRTGYKIDSHEKANELLLYVQLKARDADWDEAETKQALRWAEMIVEMLQAKAHQPKRPKYEPVLPGEIPWVRDPMIQTAQLHLAAVLATRYEASEELLAKVNKLAQDIVALWPEGKKLTELQPAELYTDSEKLGYLLYPNKLLALGTPLLHGLETAAKVVEPELASQLQTRAATLAAEIKHAQDKMSLDESKRPRGREVYRKFYDA
ncbi:hypothetical protein F5Y03DRAFT_381164 [Xylaria venustula]|nr:hypothetical protein F5Y03DRAFT_381164 [Xylaria venustula]